MHRSKHQAAAFYACIAVLALAPAAVRCDFTGDVRSSLPLPSLFLCLACHPLHDGLGVGVSETAVLRAIYYTCSS